MIENGDFGPLGQFVEIIVLCPEEEVVTIHILIMEEMIVKETSWKTRLAHTGVYCSNLLIFFHTIGSIISTFL